MEEKKDNLVELELYAEELADEKVAAAGCFSTSSTLGTATGCASTAGTFACASCS